MFPMSRANVEATTNRSTQQHNDFSSVKSKWKLARSQPDTVVKAAFNHCKAVSKFGLSKLCSTNGSMACYVTRRLDLVGVHHPLFIGRTASCQLN
ncbi:hypothetical protein D918_03907 [Trichuris suis]|nr:hypothetical protein D918_03907 [Trichuris suis]